MEDKFLKYWSLYFLAFQHNLTFPLVVRRVYFVYRKIKSCYDWKAERKARLFFRIFISTQGRLESLGLNICRWPLPGGLVGAWLAQVKNTCLEHMHEETCLPSPKSSGLGRGFPRHVPIYNTGDPSVTGEVAEPVWIASSRRPSPITLTKLDSLTIRR